MPRKFRYEAKKHVQRVQNCAAKQVSELRVSLPVHMCVDLPCLKSHLEAQPLPDGWIVCANSTTDGTLVFVKLSVNVDVLTADATLLVKVDKELRWSISCHGTLFEVGQNAVLESIPPRIHSIGVVLELLKALQEVNVCCGNAVSDFRQLAELRGNEFKDSTGCRRVASVDPRNDSIRHVACELLIPVSAKSLRCGQCTKYRGSLRVQSSRLKNKSSDRIQPNSCTPYGVLSHDEMQTRMSKLHSELRRIQKQRDRLKERLNRSLEKVGVSVSEDLSNDLRAIMENEGSRVTGYRREDCTSYFQKIFWQQQALASSKKDPRGMRWHPLMIKWCIYLRAHSQGAYETLLQSKCIQLPSQRTLRDYSHHLKPGPGFSAGVDSQLQSAVKIDKCAEREKYVMLLLDEMHVKQELVYNKSTGELVGFVNLGDVNTHLLELEKSLSSSPDEPSEILASTVLAFMVKGLFSPLEFPYAHFPCRNLTGDLMFDPFWEAVHRLERLGLKVMGATFDGASVNRKLVRLHSKNNRLVNQILNPFSTDARQFFFFFDPPHLIKTTRNCWASKARTLWNNGKEIKWGHLWTLYNKCSSSTGLTLLPKLKFEHINLNSFSKMRVDLAAQVLSFSVSRCLNVIVGPVASETSKFALTFDKFFDALNVCNFDSGKHERKPFKDPYRSGSDFRLKWLEDEFLPYLDDWKKSVWSRTGFTDSEKKRMILSQETLSGIEITTKSFVGLVRYLFTIPGVKCFLSRKICQDPLEKFFGCQRQMGGTHNNPTVKEFAQNTQALCVVSNFCRQVVKGNCRGNKRSKRDDEEEIENCNHPLPKRSKSRAKGKSTTNSREL